MASAAAAVVMRQKKYIRRFQEAGAVSPENAVDLEQVGCRDSLIFQRLVGRGIFKPNLQGKYYLDVAAAEEFQQARRTRALTAMLIVLFVVAAAIAIWGFR